MARIITPKKNRLQVADILAKHIEDYQSQYPLWSEHRKIVSDLLNCRTVNLGGHIERCNHCGIVRITYHSCRNRHCPKCQHMPRERWLEKRKDEILPTSYFHVVFTLPHELNTLILNNKAVTLNILFKAASQSLTFSMCFLYVDRCNPLGLNINCSNPPCSAPSLNCAFIPCLLIRSSSPSASEL